MPVKIERIRFHAAPPIRAFAYTRVNEFRSDGTQGRPADLGRGRQLPVSRCRVDRAADRTRRAEDARRALRISMEARTASGGRWRAQLAPPPVAGCARAGRAADRRGPAPAASIGRGFRANSNRARGRPLLPTSCAPCVNWAGRQRRTRRCRSSSSPSDWVWRRNITGGSGSC